MCEDKSSESLTAAVADSLSAVEKPAVDLVADARARMLARHSK